MAFLMRNGRPRPAQFGFTYFGVLILVTLIGLSLALAAKVVSQAMQRDNEQQLLWVGHAYRDGIEAYVHKHGRYPADLQALIADPTGTVPEHFLRRLYPDPMTGSAEWTLVKGQDGGVMGIASKSAKEPIKIANFDDDDIDFDKAKTYADWKFVYDPATKAQKYGPSVFGAPAR